jgi:predicted DNA-binding transcriptional regulator YafY
MTSPASRLLLLLSLLQTRRDWPGQLLAERLRVSDRTVRRDVDRLRDMGYRIDSMKGPDGGYRLDAGCDLPPLLFDDEQAIAITLALGAAAATGAGVEEAAVRALTTLRQVMPARLRHRVDALQFTAIGRPNSPASDPVTPEVLIEVSSAARAREVLRFDYYRPGDQREPAAAPRRAEPHHLVISNGRWYMIGWDLDRAAWRMFRADRITLRTPRGPRFDPRPLPAASVHEFVSARFKGSSTADAWPCRGKVMLALPASAVLPFAGDGVVEDLGPDQCSLDIGSWSWVALAASLGRFDCDVEVLHPTELAKAFGVLSARFGRSSGQ